MARTLMQRAARLLERAQRMAPPELRNELENLQLVDGYACQRDDSQERDVVALADWNEQDRYDATTGRRLPIRGGKLIERLGEFFERIGVQCEWSDEWSICGDCYRAIRTEPDSHGYRPQYWVGDGDIFCHWCLADNPGSYLDSLLDSENECCEIAQLDPAEHGYVIIGETRETYAPLFDGEKQKVLDALKMLGVNWIVKAIHTGSEITWSVWQKAEDE